jgi:hypothetical protein
MTSSMEFAIDLLAGLRSQVHAVPTGGETHGFDWSGLHSRLAVAHAARTELARGESPPAPSAGSFAAWRGPAVSAGKKLLGVNLTDSADGKAPAGIEGLIAGVSGAGDRGMQ